MKKKVTAIAECLGARTHYSGKTKTMYVKSLSEFNQWCFEILIKAKIKTNLTFSLRYLPFSLIYQ